MLKKSQRPETSVLKFDGKVFYTKGMYLKNLPEFEIRCPGIHPVMAWYMFDYYSRQYNTGKLSLRTHDNVMVINDQGSAIFFKRVKYHRNRFPYYAIRIVFEDENLNFPWDNGCDPRYKDQLIDKNDLSLDYSKYVTNDKITVIFTNHTEEIANDKKSVLCNI